MRFGHCRDCTEYKFLRKETGLCVSCSKENKELSTIEKLERAAIKPEDIYDSK